MQKVLKNIEGKELKLFSLFTLGLLLIVAFGSAPLGQIIEGMQTIIVSRDALITDYFELAGYGAAFLNAMIVFGISVALVLTQKIPFTGLTMAALFMNAGYALWGKNVVNIIPVFLGTLWYAKMHKTGLSRYIYTALFGTCLAPLVTELVYMLPFNQWVNLLISVAVEIFVGFVLPPLSMHTASMHMGYNLFNVGFSGGVFAFVIVCVLRAFGMESESVLIWKEGQNPVIVVGLYSYFLLAFLFGLWISRGKVGSLKRILRHPGRAVSDFVLMDGAEQR